MTKIRNAVRRLDQITAAFDPWFLDTNRQGY